MWRKTKFLSASLIAAFLFLFWQSVGICSESRTYTISETQLETLSYHLTALEQNNNELLSLLNESNLDLSEASLSLSESKKELETLKVQLAALQAETKRLDASLRTANAELQSARESFRRSEQERDKIEGRLRNQRNLWEFLCLVAVGVAVAK